MVDGELKKCPMCAEDIRAEAVKCKHCGTLLDGTQPASPQHVVGGAPPAWLPATTVEPTGSSFESKVRTVGETLKLVIGIAVLVGVVIVVVSLYRCGKGVSDAVHDVRDKHAAERAAVAKEHGIDVTATELWEAYRANEVNADGRYKGQVVRVTGVVDKVAKGLLGDPYVSLEAGDRKHVRCNFEDSVPALANIAPKQTVTLRGLGDGASIGGPTLKRCVVE